MAVLFIRAPANKISDWLVRNIGDYYGNSLDGCFGAGWRMRIEHEDIQTAIAEPFVLWRVEIEDEELALICRLSW
jgi:hypothetical protein